MNNDFLIYCLIPIFLSLSHSSTPQFPKGLLPFSTDTPVDCQRDRQASQIGCFLAGGNHE